jgi:uncharacterized protein with von Willebrand factor type A (vWA) domain
VAPSVIAAHVARVAGALRDAGISVTLSDEADALAAAALVDVSERRELRFAFRSALKIRRKDVDVFDALFDRFWSPGAGAVAEAISRAARDRRVVQPSARKPVRLAASGANEASTDAGGRGAAGDVPSWSPEALLKRKSFEDCGPEDLPAMERLVAALAARLATRPGRRLVPTRGRGRMDPRRSLRAALSTEGELLRLARRGPAIVRPRIVALCDTSGSMDAHTRFLLTFLLALKSVARRTEVFAFNTALTRLTAWLAPGKIGRSLDLLSANVPDWSGGTRIGECLEAFVEGWLDTAVDSRTVVIVVSDGLDRGETRALTDAMKAIHSRARRVLWLNPLLSDPRYEPTARGMAAALPWVDRLLPAHDLASLERVLPLLAA